MTTYARVQTLVEVADNASFDRAQQHPSLMSLTTPSEPSVGQMYSVETTGLTAYISHKTTCNGFALNNTSTLYPVAVTWFTQIGAQANDGANGFAIADAGTDDTITDLNAGGTFLTNGALAGGYVVCSTSEDPANDGRHLIQVAAANVITLCSDSTMTANVKDTTMALAFQRRNTTLVPALGTLLVTDAIVVSTNIVLVAVGGTAICTLSHF